jgi:hypothetical protein
MPTRFCYGNRVTVLYVDGVRTSRETSVGLQVLLLYFPGISVWKTLQLVLNRRLQSAWTKCFHSMDLERTVRGEVKRNRISRGRSYCDLYLCTPPPPEDSLGLAMSVDWSQLLPGRSQAMFPQAFPLAVLRSFHSAFPHFMFLFSWSLDRVPPAAVFMLVPVKQWSQSALYSAETFKTASLRIVASAAQSPSPLQTMH